jgi:hypothetical protein
MNITAQIQGGLGNQLFQYATGKALSNRLKGTLQLDLDWFNHTWADVTPREFLLAEMNTHFQVSSFSPHIKKPKWWRRIAQDAFPLSPYVVYEKPFHFIQQLNTFQPYANQDIYLIGYWQSFHYFDSIRQELIQEITPRARLSTHYQSYLDKIEQTTSAMVHIRRGDYVHLPVAAKVHGFLGLEYYQQGMDLLWNSDPDVHFFVFTDDHAWAKANLPHQEKITFIKSAVEKSAPVEELLLMTKCKKHLIANSSLSWWGAWLNTSQNPQVIAPKQWTNDLETSWSNLLPSAWIRI